MKNLVFRFYFMVVLCWQSGIAERSANGYFYDKPAGPLFDESPTLSQFSGSAVAFPPIQVPSTLGYYQQNLQPSAANQRVEIYPAKLVYENTQTVSSNVGQPIYRNPVENNLQAIAFTAYDGSQPYNSIEQPCGPEPIIAQFNPELVDLASGGPLTRQITTCGPNNDCKTITLQADVNRHLGALQAHRSFPYNYAQQVHQAEPRTSNVFINAEEPLLVRPSGRRLIAYTEIESNDPYN